MVTTLDGLLILAAFLVMLVAVPTAALVVAVLLVPRSRRAPQSFETPTPTIGQPAPPTESQFGAGAPHTSRPGPRPGLPARSPGETRIVVRPELSDHRRRWTLLSVALVGAALSGIAWAWWIHRRTGFSPSSQAVADLPLTLPFFSGLGFFAGLLIGAVVTFLLEQLTALRKHAR
jgi:hypothetical protein